jgi:glycosyltransferase involved in cell wall biosynthesis
VPGRGVIARDMPTGFPETTAIRSRVLVDLSVLSTSTRLRGIGRYVSELTRGLVAVQRDWADLELVFLERLGLDGRVTLSRDPEAALARLCNDPPRARARWSYPLRLFARRAAHAAGAGLLHLPAPGATPLGLEGTRTVTTCHDLIPYRYPERYAQIEDGFRWGRRALDRRRYLAADHVIAISRATAADLERFLGVEAERVSVVLSGIDRARWTADTHASDAEHLAALGLQKRRFVVYVGDADWRKNSEGMFRALARVRETEPALELVWVGKLSQERTRSLQAQAEALGVAGGCQFLGYVPDRALQAVYRAALATLFVSRAEGFGYPVLEAMASGCPVVTSNVSSLPEVAGDAALLVDPENPVAIAQAIVSLASDPTLRQDLKRRGLQRARRFSLESQARETLAVYRRLLDR